LKSWASPKISSSIDELEKAKKLILPGVGAFADGMKNLKQLGLVDALNRWVLKEKKPILGICLGCQLMAKESYEFGQHLGLGWIDASVVFLEPNDASLRVPHVGWDDAVQIKDKKSILFQGIPRDSLFYYTHSFKIICNQKEDVVAECDYGGVFAAGITHDNIYGTQFHPEKSQLQGLNLLKNFLEKA
jgi:glutamine amidotransferase